MGVRTLSIYMGSAAFACFRISCAVDNDASWLRPPSEPPVRFAAGADAVQTFESKASALLTQADAYRELSSSLAHQDA
jgi:hypothetical protein